MAKTSIEDCIRECLDCHRACLEHASTTCLEQGGEHVAPEHFRLMMSCAEICRTAADLMMVRSAHHAIVCAACAEICEACAKSCDKLGMKECAEACRRCAASCREMSGRKAA